MNPKLYPDLTFEALLDELASLGYSPLSNAEKIEAVKTEIKKRIHLIEAHSGKK